MTRYKGLRPGQLYLVYFNGLQLCEHVEQNCAYYSVPSYSHGGIFFIKLQRISLYKVLCYKIIADVGHWTRSQLAVLAWSAISEWCRQKYLILQSPSLAKNTTQILSPRPQAAYVSGAGSAAAKAGPGRQHGFKFLGVKFWAPDPPVGPWLGS